MPQKERKFIKIEVWRYVINMPAIIILRKILAIIRVAFNLPDFSSIFLRSLFLLSLEFTASK